MINFKLLSTLISNQNNPKIVPSGALAGYIMPAAGSPHGKFWDSLMASKKFWGHFYNVFGFLMRICPNAWVYCAFF